MPGKREKTKKRDLPKVDKIPKFMVCLNQDYNF